MQWTILKPKLLELHGWSTSGTESELHPDRGNSYNPQNPESPWPGKIKSSLPRLQEMTPDGSTAFKEALATNILHPLVNSQPKPM